MKLQTALNTIKSKLGIEAIRNEFGQYQAKYKGYILEFYTHNVGGEEMEMGTPWVRRSTDEHDSRSDYFAGSSYKNLKKALESIQRQGAAYEADHVEDDFTPVGFACVESNNVLLSFEEGTTEESKLIVSAKELFEMAQQLGFFPEGQDFQDDEVDTVFDDFDDHGPLYKVRKYSDLLNSDMFTQETFSKVAYKLKELHEKDNRKPEPPQPAKMIYWVCPTMTVIRKLYFKGYFNQISGKQDLLEYQDESGTIKRLIFPNETPGPTFFVNEFEANKRHQLNLQVALMIVNRDIEAHIRKEH